MQNGKLHFSISITATFAAESAAHHYNIGTSSVSGVAQW